MDNNSARIEASLGLLEKAWRGMGAAALWAWDQVKAIGRADTLTQQIDGVRAKISQAQGQDKNRPFSMPWDTPLAELQQQLSFLTEQERMIKRGTEAQTERNRVNKEGIAALDEVGKANERAMSKQQQADKALADYRKNLEAIKRANDASPSDALAKMLDPTVIAQTEAAIKKRGETAVKSTREVASEQEKLAQAGEKLADSLLAQKSGLSGDFGQKWAQLSAAYQKNGWSIDKLTDAQAELLAQQPAMKAGLDAETKAAADLAKTMEAYAKAGAAGVAEAERAATQAEQQLANYGLLKSEVQALGVAELERSRDLAALAGEDVSNIEKRIAARKRELAATRGIEQREDLDKTIKETTEAGQKMADSINGSLTDALMRGFEAGKGFVKNLADTAVNIFKTLILRPTISAVMSPVSAALMGGVGLTGTASAGQSGGGSGLSTAMSAASLFGSGGLGGALAGGAGWLTGATTLGGSLSAGASLIGTGSMAGVASGMGMIAGALGPIALGVALLASLIKPKTYHSGGAGSYSAEGGATTGLGVLDQGLTFGVGASHYDKGAETAAVQIAKSISGMLDATAQSFGQGAGYYAATAFADDTSKDGAWGSLIIRRLDDTILNWADTQTSKWAPKEFSDGDAGKAEYLAALAQGVRGALDAMDLPGWASDMLAALGDVPTLEGLAQTVDTINAASSAIGSMRKNLAGFADATDATISALVKAAGGMDSLVASASSYYDNYYSEAERAANTTRDVAAALSAVGLQMPTTRDEFRALVESQMALGESSASAVAALLGVSGAFASVTESASEAAAAAQKAAADTAFAAQKAAEEARRRAEQIAQEKFGLESKLMQLLGDTVGLRAREIDALDASNRALQNHIYAIEDARAAYEKSIDVAQGAYSGLERAVDAEKTALQQKYDLEKKGYSDRLQVQSESNAAQIASARAAADSIRGIASALTNALKSSQVKSPELDFARLTGARSTISGAAGSGNIFASGLESALSVAGADNRQFYGKFEDYAFAQGVTAGEIAKLSASAQTQLSASESILVGLNAQNDVAKLISDAEMAALDAWYAAELKKLDDTLETGKQQLNALLGIDDSVLSVADAVANLANAINASNAALQAQRAAEAMSSSVIGDSGTGAYATVGNNYAIEHALWRAQEAAISGKLSDPDYLKGLGFSDNEIELAQANAAWQALNGSSLDTSTLLSQQLGLLKGLAINDLASGAVRDLRAEGSLLYDGGATNFSASGYHDIDKKRELEKLLGFVPQYAVGTPYVPQDGLAYLHKGEAVIPAQYNPAQYRSGNDDTAAALRAMSERLAAIEANTRATAGHTAGTDRKLARVVQNDAIKTETA